MRSVSLTLREKCPNTEFFLVPIFLYSVRIQENTDQKKLRIWHFSRSQLNKLKGESSKRKQVKKLLFLVASVFLPF